MGNSALLLARDGRTDGRRTDGLACAGAQYAEIDGDDDVEVEVAVADRRGRPRSGTGWSHMLLL